MGELYNFSQFKKLVEALGKSTQDSSVEKARVTVEHFYSAKCETAEKDYITRIKSLIDEGKVPPIIFFDVDFEGFPRVDGDGSRQH